MQIGYIFLTIVRIYILFVVLYKINYEVFSIYEIEAEYYYITTNFKDEEFLKYIQTVKERSIKDFNIQVNEEDNILTLSTCGNDNDDRVVLHAREVK